MLAEVDVIHRSSVVPNRPPSGQDILVQIGILENDPGIHSPRTAEVDLAWPCHVRVIYNIPAGIVPRASRSGNKPTTSRFNDGFGDPCQSGLAPYEVHRALNQALRIELKTLQIQSIKKSRVEW